jgi:hypothetical protein
MITSTRILRKETKAVVEPETKEAEVQNVKIETEAVVEDTEPEVSSEAPEGTLRTRLVAFLIGIGFSSLVGGFMLHQSFQDAASSVTSKVDRMSSELVTSQKILLDRITDLEGRVAKVEKK